MSNKHDPNDTFDPKASLSNDDYLDHLLHKSQLSPSEEASLCGITKYVVFKNWPPNLHHCTALESLDVNGSWHKKCVSEEISRFTNLKLLDASFNSIAELTPGVCKCILLENLHIRSNKLRYLPPTLGDLYKLKELDVRENKLRELPSSIGNCVSLEKVNISFNKLTYLPDEIHKLRNLNYLDVSNNRLLELPPGIYGFTSLQHLDVQSNALAHIPSQIGHLHKLKHLNAASNNLSELPTTIGGCVCLNNLNVSGNHLTYLPQQIGRLNDLIHLSAFRNQLTELPSSIGDLCKLEHLDISSNKLKELPPSFCKCLQLEYICVDHNRLASLPKQIGDLRKLERINVAQNKLREVPLSIGKCLSLSNLDLSCNELVTLPNELANCVELQNLQIHDNRLNIPTVVTDRGARGIKNYLRNLRGNGGITSKRRNVMVVGNRKAGKSSCVGCLINEKATLTKEKDRTHVLERHTLERPAANRNAQPLDIRINDFGSKERCNATTSIFWTPNSVFLVLFDLSTYSVANHKEQISYWIEWISSRVPRARIFLIATHVDKVFRFRRKLETVSQMVKEEEKVLTDQIQEKIRKSTGNKKMELQKIVNERPIYTNGVFPISNKTYKGIETLWNAIISLLSNPAVFPEQFIPREWFELRSSIALAQMPRDQMWLAWGTIKTLGRQVNLLDERTLCKAVEYLHLCGDVIWDPKGPFLKDVVFHKPEEIIVILQAVISHDLTKQLHTRDSRFSHFTKERLTMWKKNLQASGVITRDLLRCLLKSVLLEDETEENVLDMVIELLVHFSIAYKPYVEQATCAKDTRCQEIRIPWYLPEKKPSNLPWTKCLPKDMKQMSFKLVFLRSSPPCFFETLTSRARRYMPSSIDWKKGLYMWFTAGKLLLELQEEDGHEYISISVRCPSFLEIWQLLRPIERDLDDLLEKWPGILCDLFIVCPKCIEKDVQEPHLFDMEMFKAGYPHVDVTCPNPKDLSAIPLELFYPKRSGKDRQLTKVLERKRARIVQMITPDAGLYSRLIGRKVLTIRDKDEIMLNATVDTQVERLLDVLSRRPDRDVQHFIACLRECNHGHAADLIEKG